MKHGDLKKALIECIYALKAFDGISGLNELKDKIERNTFNLVVVGQFKRGKTTLINALLGSDFLPVAVVPLTSIVTVVTYGRELTAEVHYNDGKTETINPQDIAQFVTEKNNPKNIKNVHEVVITYPSEYLSDGVRLIDTPGVGSIYQHNTDVAYEYLPQADAAIFLLSVDQPLSQAELEFLKDVKQYSHKIFFLLNKADHLSEKDLKESLEFSASALKDALSSDVKIFPISAKLALEGKVKNQEELFKQSGLREFSAELDKFLHTEKGKVLILSALNNLLRIISHAIFKLELEYKSLSLPLEDLQSKIATFELKRQETLIQKQDFDILLDGEIQRLLRQMLDEDITKFRKELIKQAEDRLEVEFQNQRHLQPKALKLALEQAVANEVRQALNVWRAKEDDRLAKAFEAICKRFVLKIDEAVDTLLKFSSELFEIPFEAIHAEAFWHAKSNFYYRFKEQPGSIEMVASSITLALPKFIADKIILKNTKEYLVRIVDLQLARAGNDFEERTNKSKLAFRWEMLQRIEATLEGITTAVQKALSLREQSSQEVQKRKSEITKSLQKLNSIKQSAEEIKTTALRSGE